MSTASDGFTASERADMALLRSAGLIASNTGEERPREIAPAANSTISEVSLNAQERADMAILRAAGIVKPGDDA